MRAIGPKIFVLEFVVSKGGGYLQAKVVVCVKIEKFPRYSRIETKESFGSVQAESCFCGLQRVVRILHVGANDNRSIRSAGKVGETLSQSNCNICKMHKIDMKAYSIL
jgi:hypothetical protein